VGTWTVTINTDTGVITGDDDNAGTFYGTAFTVSIADGLAQFKVLGDLHIGGDIINVVGANALSLLVGNNVFIDPDAQFNLSANGNQWSRAAAAVWR
jgi:hypothetical protein